jgi:hypothetical protein
VTDQLTLDLPVSDREPRSWKVVYWTYHVRKERLFVTRDDAWRWASDNVFEDWCAVDGVLKPDGTWDLDWAEKEVPWRDMKDYE